MFNRHCHNLQGKIRLERNDFPGVLGRVKSGVRQVFERIDGSAADEVDARFDCFTKKVRPHIDIRPLTLKTIPSLLRSAMSRQNTLIVIPSYFDFVRVVNHLRKTEIAYAAISE